MQEMTRGFPFVEEEDNVCLLQYHLYGSEYEIYEIRNSISLNHRQFISSIRNQYYKDNIVSNLK